jgi:hypothetical protein
MKPIELVEKVYVLKPYDGTIHRIGKPKRRITRLGHVVILVVATAVFIVMLAVLR